MKHLFIIGLGLICIACTAGQVTNVNPETGYFKTKKFAQTITSNTVDLDSKKSLLLIPNEDFVRGQIANINYFDKIMTVADLEKEIVQNNLQDKISSVQGRIGINRAYTEYKHFLWFRLDTRGSGTDKYAQFILTDPETLDDIFVAEIHLDYIWEGVNDQSTWYPLFNELIRYIEKNSNTFISKDVASRSAVGTASLGAGTPESETGTEQATIDSADSGSSKQQFTGTFISEITGKPGQYLKSPERRLRLVHDGSKLTGQLGASGKIWGEVSGNVVTFEYFINGNAGNGEWIFALDGGSAKGKWVPAATIYSSSDGTYEWNLRRIE